jgi:hypothetical protein
LQPSSNTPTNAKKEQKPKATRNPKFLAGFIFAPEKVNLSLRHKTQPLKRLSQTRSIKLADFRHKLLMLRVKRAQSSADVISLGVDYSVDEKLTYDVTLSLSVEVGGTSMAVNSDSTLVLEVLSFDNEIYVLNYTKIVPYGDQINITSTILEVKENEMVTVLALYPAGFQSFSAEDQSEDSPLFSAAFDQ